MRDTPVSAGERGFSNERAAIVNYLPGMPRLSDGPDQVEWFLSRLFRRHVDPGVAFVREN